MYDNSYNERPGFGAAYVDNFGTKLIPERKYFMMGDNRDNSKDSRFWGYMPEENMIGKAMIIYWSFDRYADAKWYEVWNWWRFVRWKRIGKIIK